MEQIVLKAEKREVVGKRVKVLRQEGKLPAILYGKNMEGLPIALDAKEATLQLREVTSSSLVVVEVDGDQHTTLVRERQRDFIKGDLLHIDFQVVSLTEKVRADVSVVLEGEAPAIKDFGALLVTGLEHLEVESFPQDLPERIVVDVSGLESIGEGIYVRDLVLPPEVDVLTDQDELLVVVSSMEMELEEEEEEVLEEELLEEGELPEGVEEGEVEAEEPEAPEEE